MTKHVMNTQRDYDDENFEWVNGKRVLKDHGRLRVPMYLADGRTNPHLTDVQRAVAGTAARDAKAQAYAAYDAEIQQAYRHGSHTTPTLWAEAPSGAGSNGPLGVSKRDSAAKFHDGTPDGGGNCPGWRLPIGDSRKAQHDALVEYERELTNRWRLGDEERTCSECDGSGEDEAGNDCPVCGGEGVLPAAYETTDAQTAHASLAQRNDDSRPLAQRMQDHKRTMDALYRARDAELENAWRNK